MNAFKHGLAAIQKRREEGVPTEHEESALNPFIAQCSPDLQSGVCFNEPQPVRNRKGKFPTCFWFLQRFERLERFELGC
jgi:hypothetical protein